MTCFADTLTTPFGPFSFVLEENGSLAATAFGPLESFRARMGACNLIGEPAATRSVRDQVLAYAAGELMEFDLPLAVQGTAFQQRVWSALRQIPFGTTRSYGELAAEVGMPAAARAIGRANATNPVCLIVPCHRVIGADGSLTGFAFGEDLKRRLLDHERRVVLRSGGPTPTRTPTAAPISPRESPRRSA
jgi:methylated-DNA-[protein]-cysteine S-methyltransferase